MSNREQIIKYARITAGMIRLARDSRQPSKLLSIINHSLDKIKEVGTRLESHESSLCLKVVYALEKMLAR